MKTIDKMIIDHYQEEQKNSIKNKAGFQNETAYPYSSMKIRTRLWIPSIVSLSLSLIFLITASLLWINSHPQAAKPFSSYAEKHLQAEAIDYIKRPIKTLIDHESNTIIAIYYGVVGDALAEHSHYLVFEIISDKDIAVDTYISNDETMIGLNRFILEDKTRNFYAFETIYDRIDIQLLIGTSHHDLQIDFASYYDFLRYS